MVTNTENSSKVDMLNATYDGYEGVIVNVNDDMDENVFTILLQT